MMTTHEIDHKAKLKSIEITHILQFHSTTTEISFGWILASKQFYISMITG